jgi:hypothetical protein
MNIVYKVIFNRLTGAFQAVSETATSRGKSSGTRANRFAATAAGMLALLAASPVGAPRNIGTPTAPPLGPATPGASGTRPPATGASTPTERAPPPPGKTPTAKRSFQPAQMASAPWRLIFNLLASPSSTTITTF